MPRLRRQRGPCRCHVRFHPGDRRRISSQIAFLQLALDTSSLFSRIVAEAGLTQAFAEHPCEEFCPGFDLAKVRCRRVQANRRTSPSSLLLENGESYFERTPQ